MIKQLNWNRMKMENCTKLSNMERILLICSFYKKYDII